MKQKSIHTYKYISLLLIFFLSVLTVLPAEAVSGALKTSDLETAQWNMVAESSIIDDGSFCLEVEHLEIQPGETFAILGRTGSGKTVLREI